MMRILQLLLAGLHTNLIRNYCTEDAFSRRKERKKKKGKERYC
jgi:hypothetical protein